MGFVDTLLYYRKMFPKRKCQPFGRSEDGDGLKNHQLDTVVKHFASEMEYEKHCALGDSKALHAALKASTKGKGVFECLHPFSVQIECIEERMEKD